VHVCYVKSISYQKNLQFDWTAPKNAGAAVGQGGQKKDESSVNV